MSQGICPSCGASAINEVGKCAFCGTLRKLPANVRFISAEEKRAALKAEMESTEFKKKQLLNEIVFFKNQYKETSHPSIPAKLENAQNKLRKLT